MRGECPPLNAERFDVLAPGALQNAIRRPCTLGPHAASRTVWPARTSRTETGTLIRCTGRGPWIEQRIVHGSVAPALSCASYDLAPLTRYG